MDIQEDFARQTIELARQARLAGNHPFGALLVVNGKVTLTAQNTVTTDCDPTAHAETNLVSEAIRQLSPVQIRRSVLYTSCEPCAMCVGKMYWAGIRSIAYALPAEELAALAGRDFLIHRTAIAGRGAPGASGLLVTTSGLTAARPGTRRRTSDNAFRFSVTIRRICELPVRVRCEPRRWL